MFPIGYRLIFEQQNPKKQFSLEILGELKTCKRTPKIYHIMKITQIKNGKVEIRKNTGSLIRTIGNGKAVSADFNQDQSLLAVTLSTGKVEIRKDSGSLVRTIGTGNARNARWNGEEIAIETEKGKTELRKASGSLIRTI